MEKRTPHVRWETTNNTDVCQRNDSVSNQGSRNAKKNIETALTKMTRNLQHLREEGGINLQDIKSRNKAIKVTWIKSYLDLSSSCPTWTFNIDLLLHNLNPNKESTDPTNPFLLSWDPPIRGPRVNTLPLEIRSLLKTTNNSTSISPQSNYPEILKYNYPHGVT